MSEQFVLMVVTLAAIAGGTIVLAPLVRALARRVGGEPQVERRLAALEAVLADVQDNHGQVSQLEDRLSKMERGASSGHQGHRGRRGSSHGSRSNGPPKVGKLWTPPPYKA